MLLRAAKFLTISLLILVTYLLLWPVPFDPVVHTLGAIPSRTGIYAENTALSGVEHMISGVEKPEDVTQGPGGYFYSGLEDGRIVRFKDDGRAPETFVETGGRPLGMQFDSKGNLIVADATRGLLSISSDQKIKVLVDTFDGKKLLFVDDLDITSDGKVWFSDASQKFDLAHFILEAWETRPTGRLFSFDPSTGDTEMHLDNLMFANGVALGPDEAYVLVNETFRMRTLRLWLKGERAGQSETFMDGLPGFPDNLSYNDDGIFWMALTGPRMEMVESLWTGTFLRKVLFRLPSSLHGAKQQPFGWVLGVNLEGKVVHNLQDPSGTYGTITSVNEFDGQLYLGSVAMTSVGRFGKP